MREALEILEAVEWSLNGACYICKGLEPRHFSNCALKEAIILLKQQPPAGERTKKIRERWLAGAPHLDSKLDYAICAIIDLCDRLDRAESINADLLAACEAVSKSVGDFRPDGETMILIEAAIAKAEQVGE